MELTTISQVSKSYGISTRTLRYYEQIGLLQSTKADDYAYRVYSPQAIQRLQQIIMLRKLRIPLKKIGDIFSNPGTATIISVFMESVSEINDELTSLSTMRLILEKLLGELKAKADIPLNAVLFHDEMILEAINSLTLTKINFKEERSMDDLNKANDTLSTLKHVRIIYLPPCTVAAIHDFGDTPEDSARKQLDEFVRTLGLQKTKPDLRVYGFNNPSPQNRESLGYEFWVTIPEDLEVQKPLEKKQFDGGLYAAHCIKMGDFHEWKLLGDWINSSSEYEYDIREPLGMSGGIEEHLNAVTYYHENETDFIQLDLLAPVKRKPARI